MTTNQNMLTKAAVTHPILTAYCTLRRAYTMIESTGDASRDANNDAKMLMSVSGSRASIVESRLRHIVPTDWITTVSVIEHIINRLASQDNDMPLSELCREMRVGKPHQYLRLFVIGSESLLHDIVEFAEAWICVFGDLNGQKHDFLR